jgi:hypothetical protein
MRFTKRQVSELTAEKDETIAALRAERWKLVAFGFFFGLMAGDLVAVWLLWVGQ